jgi:hypothetical protein
MFELSKHVYGNYWRATQFNFEVEDVARPQRGGHSTSNYEDGWFGWSANQPLAVVILT